MSLIIKVGLVGIRVRLRLSARLAVDFRSDSCYSPRIPQSGNTIMLKTKSPRYNNVAMAPKQSEASRHLWDDFVNQIASYARRNNAAYGGVPVHLRSQANITSSTWYNKPNAVR
jgi:hypothetical protein